MRVSFHRKPHNPILDEEQAERAMVTLYALHRLLVKREKRSRAMGKRTR